MKLEQYESAKALFGLLDSLSVTEGEQEEYIYEAGGDWEPCENCGEVINECRCNDDGPRYDAYNDEAAFD